MHPFPILERWISKDIVVERQNQTTSLSTSSAAATSRASKCPQKHSVDKCPYLLSRNEDSVTSMIDDDSDTSVGMTAKNVKSMPVNEGKNHTNAEVVSNKATHPFVIQKNTQIVMFPSDWKHDQSWSVFGAGKRACPGTPTVSLPDCLIICQCVSTYFCDSCFMIYFN